MQCAVFSLVACHYDAHRTTAGRLVDSLTDHVGSIQYCSTLPPILYDIMIVLFSHLFVEFHTSLFNSSQALITIQ